MFSFVRIQCYVAKLITLGDEPYTIEMIHWRPSEYNGAAHALMAVALEYDMNRAFSRLTSR